MALIEVRHDNALPFGDRPVDANKLALLAHGINLVQRELVL